MNISLLGEDAEIKPIRKGEQLYLVSKEVLSVEITQFLQLLPESQEISFHDQFYSNDEYDPGAYVSIRKEEDNFLYMFGNHHWSTKWQRQSVELLTAYILINA